MNIRKILYKLSLKAYKKGEVPVAAIIVRNGKIISKAYNKRKNSNNPLYHSEILAIVKACKKLHSWVLSDCEMYVSLMPCHMCREVINETRIKNVYFYCSNDKVINYKTSYNYVVVDQDNEFSSLLTNFFKKLR